jgi:hypothetical protein
MVILEKMMLQPAVEVKAISFAALGRIQVHQKTAGDQTAHEYKGESHEVRRNRV